MYEWLYGQNGYYASMPHIGKKGDFYTSVSSSMFFGGSIGAYIVKVIDEGFLSRKSAIVEIGAHRGYLLADIIQFIYTLRAEFLETLEFVIIEPLEKAQKAQKEYFQKAFGEQINIKILKNIKSFTCKEAFIVSNELFDAFVCEVVYKNSMLFMDNHKPLFKPMSKEIAKIVQKYEIEKGEVALGYDGFVGVLERNIGTFEFISFDYGEREKRDDISLRVYKKHEVFAFFELTTIAGKQERLEEFFGKSDITYDVFFERLIKAFNAKGIRLHAFKSQNLALTDFGLVELLDILRQNVDENIYAQELEKAKRLILPNFLGERFKMISFRKG